MKLQKQQVDITFVDKTVTLNSYVSLYLVYVHEYIFEMFGID